jgi:6-phosphogluconolactonase
MESIIVKHNAEVKIFKDSAELFKDSAGYISASIRYFINNLGRCTIVLSGGNTPKRLYDEISNKYRESIEWQKVYFFWGDERCVPPTSNESNYKTAYEHLLSMIPVPEKNVFRIKGEKTPEDAAREYENSIKGFWEKEIIPSFDITLLGIGTDGHTASLFPGSDAFNIKDRLAVSVYAEKLNSWRVTLTFPVINNSKNILFIAEGKEKSEIIKKVFNNNKNEFPVKGVNPSNGKLIWFLDKDAAGTAFVKYENKF